MQLSWYEMPHFPCTHVCVARAIGTKVLFSHNVHHKVMTRGSQANADTSVEAAPSSAAEDEGLIFGLGDEGAWDEAAVGSPVVRTFGVPSALSL